MRRTKANNNSKRKKILILAFALLLCIILISIFSLFRSKPRSHTLTLYGNVDVRQVDIGFRVSGQVASLAFEEGDCVQAGCLMASLDKTPYDSQIKQAKANAASLEASLKVADILL